MLILSPSYYTHSNIPCGKNTPPNFCLFLGLPRLLSNSQNFPGGGGRQRESGHPDKFHVPCTFVSKACYVKVVLFYILSYSFSSNSEGHSRMSVVIVAVSRRVSGEIHRAETQAHTHTNIIHRQQMTYVS